MTNWFVKIQLNFNWTHKKIKYKKNIKLKDAKEKLQNLIDALNIYWDDADFDIHVYDNGKFNTAGIYTPDFDNWLLYNRDGKVILAIE